MADAQPISIPVDGQFPPGVARYCVIAHYPDYCVGDDGSIWSRRPIGTPSRDPNSPRGPWRRMSPGKTKGYPRIELLAEGQPSKVRFVHVLVLEAFRGPKPPGTEGAHQNGVRTDCRLENVFWKTHVDNIADSIRHGTHVCGAQFWNSRLTEEQAIEILNAWASGAKTQGQLAREYCVQQGSISALVNGRTWRHLPRPASAIARPERAWTAKGENKKAAKLTAQKVIEIRALFESGISQPEIAKRFGVRATAISNVITRRTWSHVH